MEPSIIKFSNLRKDFDLLCKGLLKDIMVITNEIKKEDKQTWRRLYVKSLVSIIETQTFFLRKHITITGEIDDLGLSEDQERILFKRDKNNAKVRYNKLPLEKYIVFMLEVFSYVNYSMISIDKKSKDYNYLVVLIQTRHRITHPSVFSDIAINDKEIKICEAAFNAYQDALQQVMASSADALTRNAEGLKKFLKEHK